MKKKLKVLAIVEMVYGILANYIAVILFQFFSSSKEGSIVISWKISAVIECVKNNYNDPFFIQFFLIINLAVFFVAFYLAFMYESKAKILDTGLVRITDKIQIPVSAGNGQYGFAHFMGYGELDKIEELNCYKCNVYKKSDALKKPQSGGVVVGIRAIGTLPDKGDVEDILYIGEDRHVLLVGATRSGKSRRLIMESIWLTALAGENMVITDPKGELWAYTSLWVEAHGYSVVTIDLREPNKGSHYNFMQEIIDELYKGDIAEAIDLTWDLVSVLVGEAKGEPIWHNGECAAIAACILVVATEAPEEYKNLTNVYYFLYNMATPDEFGEMPINRYLQSLPETHPARAVFAMASIAHTKTRGSFFSSALGTLKHFTNPKIAEMTSKTDYRFSEMAEKKTVVYLILPDEKKTLYSLGSMYIMQHYIYNVKAANANGGRCPIDWWYLCDEFGNMPYIPPIPQFLSVGAGRGMRFLLAVQAFQQIKKIYKDDYETIKNNCDCWMYLKCSDGDTKKEFSDRLGTYTIQVNTTNHSSALGKGKDGSHGASLTSRHLLFPDEVGLIEAPHNLVSFAGKFPIMLISPDLSYYRANQDLGLGDKEHNKKVIIERNSKRKARPVGEIQLWGIWNEFVALDEYPDDMDDYGEEQLSFLD